ncbi:AmmeMemoRadiSam system protein B [Sulfurimonas sp.]|uniref:AmmeMemoRadiSam system protein B n=1 Tax=Sulfurimonas sp. TaxID=2022749 RepID=UPI0035645668
MKRDMSVAGAFYPDNEFEINQYLEHFNKLCSLLDDIPSSKAIIVPHAGYIYSGYTASLSYKALKKSGVKKFVVIGPSHRIAFNGISLCTYDSYKTPLGDISSNSSMVEKLGEKFSLGCLSQAHMEHSTEVQFPFLRHYIDDVEIIELVYSSIDPSLVSDIIDFVYADDDWGVVISTDLSHFYNIKDANTLDSICVDAVKNLDIDELHSGCEACGMIGVEAMLMSAKKLNLKSKIIDYRTSADASGDESRVVGYMSACFI